MRSDQLNRPVKRLKHLRPRTFLIPHRPIGLLKVASGRFGDAFLLFIKCSHKRSKQGGERQPGLSLIV